MTSRPLVYLGLFILVLALIAAVGYVMKSDAFDKPIIDVPINNSTSTVDVPTKPVIPPVVATTTYNVPLPGSTTIDTTSWPIYIDPERRFSVEHPKNVIENYSNGVVTFTFQKNLYFTWPLLDDAKVTISVEPKCPQVIKGGVTGNGIIQEFELNGMVVKRTIGEDVGAGNRYLEISYDMMKSGFCYHLSFLDHGANGSGLYVDSASLIKRYDAEHDKAMQEIFKVLNGMVSNFGILAD